MLKDLSELIQKILVAIFVMKWYDALTHDNSLIHLGFLKYYYFYNEIIQKFNQFYLISGWVNNLLTLKPTGK